MSNHGLALATLLLPEVVRKAWYQPSIEWKIDGDLMVSDARSLVEKCRQQILRESGQFVFRRIEFEVIKTEKPIRSHYHEHTDSVVAVLDWTSNVFDWELIIEDPLPYPGGYDLAHHQLRPAGLFVIPRMVVHGFSPRQGDKSCPLYLLSASSSDPRPPGVNDTFYV